MQRANTWKVFWAVSLYHLSKSKAKEIKDKSESVNMTQARTVF